MSTVTLYPSDATDVGYANAGGEYFVGGYNSSYVEIGAYGSNPDRAWLRFLLTDLPSGESIESAILTLEPYSSLYADTCAISIAAVNASNAAIPSDSSACMTLETMSATADLTLGAWQVGTSVQYDIAEIVQAFVDRSDYMKGNALLLLIDDNGSTVGAYRRFDSITYSSGSAKPSLSVTWGTGVSGIRGAGAVVAPMAVIAGTGNGGANVGAVVAPMATMLGYGGGRGVVSASMPVIAGTGSIENRGSGAVMAPMAVVSGLGGGVGAVTAPMAEVAGLGGGSGTGAVTAPMPVIAGAGITEAVASGAVTAPMPVIAGIGTVGSVGAGAVRAPMARICGQGEVGTMASGVVMAPMAVVSGRGSILVTGVGVVMAPMARICGQGEGVYTAEFPPLLRFSGALR